MAVITRMSGCSPLARSVARCMTPKRCCSSMIASPSSRNAIGFLRRARACRRRGGSIRRRARRAARAASSPASPPVRSAIAEARRLEQPPDVDVVLLGEDFGRRHERDLQAVLHRDQGGHERDDRLARADVALQQPVHRLRPLHVADDFANHLLLIAGQLERQHAPRRLADLVGDDDRTRLALGARTALAQDQAALKQEELLEDQPALRAATGTRSARRGGAARAESGPR